MNNGFVRGGCECPDLKMIFQRDPDSIPKCSVRDFSNLLELLFMEI